MILRLIAKGGPGAKLTWQQTRSCYHYAIPSTLASPRINTATTEVNVNLDTIQLLERLSLVDFANVEGLKRLESAIQLADSIKNVDTAGIEPLYTVLENEKLFLREDAAVRPDNVDKLLQLAARTEEGYYQTPQGNVPLAPTNTYDRT